MNLAMLVDSQRNRDLRVIDQLVQVAYKNYRWQTDVPRKSPNYIYQESLDLLRVAWPKLKITVPPTRVCSLTFALHRIENKAIVKLDHYNLHATFADMRALQARTGMKKIDPSKLDTQERKIYEKIMSVLRPAVRQRNFVEDMQRIKLLAHASKIVYLSNMSDVAVGGGDVKYIGAGIAADIKKKTLDKHTQQAIGFWRIIHKMVPSNFLKQWMMERKLFAPLFSQSEAH